MTNLDEVRTREARTSTMPADLAVVVGAAVAALGAWLVWQAGGADLTVRSGGDVREIGAGSVAVTTVLVSVAALGLLRLLEHRSPSGLQTWTVIAGVVWAVSLLGPFGATTVAAGLGLASLHLVVGAVVMFGGRWVHCVE